MVEQHIAAVLPLLFASIWLTVSTILSLLSGWFRLMARFPNLTEAPLLRIRRQSGTMGRGVSLHGVLTLSVCPSGLRVGMMRLFGPFCRDFFVPWEVISVTRKKNLFRSAAKLRLGRPAIGSLTIPAHVANRLARAAIGLWPETGSFPKESHRDTRRRLVTEWALVAGAAALFFTLAPLVFASPGARPPIVVGILFPALFFGAVTIVRYFRERD